MALLHGFVAPKVTLCHWLMSFYQVENAFPIAYNVVALDFVLDRKTGACFAAELSSGRCDVTENQVARSRRPAAVSGFWLEQTKNAACWILAPGRSR